MDRDYWFGTDTMHLSQDNLGHFGGMNHSLRTGLDWFINKKNTLVLNGLAKDWKKEVKAYEAAIKKAGGIDFQVLGIGSD